MSEKFLSSAEYLVLQSDYPELFDGKKRRELVDVIGSYHQKIADCLPENLYPYFPGSEREVVLQYPEYVGKRVLEVLNLSEVTLEREKQIGSFYLSEILRDRSGMRIWRSADTERVFSYDVSIHGDTIVFCTDTDTEVQGYLSFYQSVHQLITSLLLYVRSIDPMGGNTLGKWDWQKAFFSGGNPWK